LTTVGNLPGSSFYSVESSVALADLAQASTLGGRLEELRGASVVIAVQDQLTAALLLIELDGVAGRIVLCPPDLPDHHLTEVVRTAAADALVHDGSGVEPDALGAVKRIAASTPLTKTDALRRQSVETEWVLLTSGTTGAPKLVAHTLASLAGSNARAPTALEHCVWSTFYDIRRYGGLQIYLRAVLGRVSLVLSSAKEPVVDFLSRAGAIGVTHISGTPTHWRRALMSGAAQRIAPRYVRLSGEIADQGLLDNLRSVYPNARVVHAFASTEAGLAFDVEDGKAGFPANLLDRPPAGVELKVQDGTLRIRGVRNANRYLGEAAPTLVQSDGYVDTGDMVELQSGRYYFVGRKGGVINVGGLKVHPEEVEAVINTHPRVRMSLVKARKNPITGAIVVAEVVMKGDGGPAPDPGTTQTLTQEIIDSCRRALPAHKVPAMVRIVPALEVSASGKLVRPGA